MGDFGVPQPFPLQDLSWTCFKCQLQYANYSISLPHASLYWSLWVHHLPRTENHLRLKAVPWRMGLLWTESQDNTVDWSHQWMLIKSGLCDQPLGIRVPAEAACTTQDIAKADPYTSTPITQHWFGLDLHTNSMWRGDLHMHAYAWCLGKFCHQDLTINCTHSFPFLCILFHTIKSCLEI